MVDHTIRLKALAKRRKRLMLRKFISMCDSKGNG